MGRLAMNAVFIVGTACLVCPGCAPTYRDAATGVEARYEWETLRARFDPPISEVFCATRAAAHDLDLGLLRCHLDGIAGEILARDAHFDIVTIRLEALPESGSLMTIRVGVFGSKNKSVVLLQHIVENLDRPGEAFSKSYVPGGDP